MGDFVSGIYGLEKFANLEDKIYRTIEQFKRERQARESLEREVLSLRRDVSMLNEEKERLELQVERLLIGGNAGVADLHIPIISKLVNDCIMWSVDSRTSFRTDG